MAVLEKIRVKFGLVASIIIAFGLLSFIIDPNALMTAFQTMSDKYDVGEINGKAISYTDFQEDVAKFSTINEMLTGSSTQSSQQQAQARDAAWQSLIYKYLFVKKANAAGINVGVDEMLEMTTGTDLSPLISQNPAFVDQNGVFSKEQLVRFIQNIDSDQSGSLRTYWTYLQNSVDQQRYFDKYASLFNQSNFENPLMLSRNIAENNNTTDVEFVMIPLGFETDSSIVISDNEIKQYYNNHKKFFKQRASRDIEYVVFQVVPSQTDIAETAKQMAELQPEFAVAENVKNFTTKNSDLYYNGYWYKAGELKTVDADVEDFVWNGRTETSDVIAKGNDFYIARVVDTKNIPDSVYVRHILLTEDNASEKADSLVNVLSRRGSDFAKLAQEYSEDKQSAVDGGTGNLGWFTQNYIIPGFEPVLTASAGKPFKLTTQYGTHVVEVVKTSAPVAKKQVAIVKKTASPSKETVNGYYAQANNFAAAAAGSFENYKKAVDTLGVYSHPVNKMLESADRLGSIENTKEVTRWAFDNKPGKVSNIITVDNDYFVIATVKAAHKEGVAELSEVSSTIKQTLYYEKFSEKKAKDVAEQIKGMTDLQAIAEKFGTSVSSQSGIAFSSLNSQGLDPKFIGAVSVAKEGVLSGPVAGSIGTYVFKVTGRDQGSFYTEDDAKARAAQFGQYQAQSIIPVMMDQADVKDNRARFY